MFCDVDTDDEAMKSKPGWLLSMKHSGDNIFFEKADKRSREAKNRILVKNECMGSRRIAIGMILEK